MTAFQTFAWNRLLIREWCGWRLHAAYSRCFVYLVSDGDVPRMLLPVIVYTVSTKTKWFGSRRGIYPLGHGSYSDYLNAVYLRFDPLDFDALCAALRNDFPGFPITLTSVREDVSPALCLRERNTPYTVSTVAVSVKRRESAEAYEASLSKKTRANLRKAMNRIRRDGVDFTLEITGPINDPALLDEMVRLHVRRTLTKNTKHDGVLHVLSSYVRKAYRKYRDLHNNIIAMSMRENPHSVVVLVRMNGALVGYQYGLREAHAIRLLQTCFDEDYKFYSPLFRASFEFIRTCCEDTSLREIDFTRGDEEFKYRLGGEEIRLYDFAL